MFRLHPCSTFTVSIFAFMLRSVFIMVCWFYISVAPAMAQEGLLPQFMRHSSHEYSGMCMYGSRIFLLPQNKANAPYNGYIHSIDTAMLWIDKDLKVHVPDAAFSTYKLTNYNEMASGIKHFEGFEAIAITNNTVFLSVETGSDTDYIIKGYLKDSTITLATAKLAIPKLHKDGTYLPNAGFEGMAIHGRQLLIGFEYNYLGDSAMLFMADTSFNESFVPVRFKELPFRLTDICTNGNSQNSYLAINHYWNLGGNSNHREAYYKNIDPSRDADLKHWVWNECFTRIIEIKVNDTRTGLTWRTKQVIPNKDCVNWEGIVPYRQGVLLISDDNKIPLLETKLRYYPLSGN